MQNNSPDNAIAAAAALLGGAFLLVWLAIAIVLIISLWRIFSKAGQPGWAAIIPIFNAYILCKVAGKPGWWVLLLLIPCLNVVFAFMIALGLAEKFGKGAGFAVGLFFLPFIFYPILAFSDASYESAAAQY